ncbi:MAG: A24 family peptidase [Desulfobacteraceae bacterium]
MNPFQDVIFINALIIILLIAAVIDLRTFKIPNIVTIPAAVGALTYYGGQFGFSGLLFSLAGLGTGLLLLLIPYLMNGIGGGDVKLMGVVGAFLGAKAVAIAFLFTAIVGGIYAVSLIFLHRQAFRGFFKNRQAAFYEFLLTRKIPAGSNAQCSKGPRLKYGLAITFGTGLYIVSQVNSLTFI